MSTVFLVRREVWINVYINPIYGDCIVSMKNIEANLYCTPEVLELQLGGHCLHNQYMSYLTLDVPYTHKDLGQSFSSGSRIEWCIVING